MITERDIPGSGGKKMARTPRKMSPQVPMFIELNSRLKYRKLETLGRGTATLPLLKWK